jgi:hypothetical protein
MAPGFNYMEKRADWQEYLDKKLNKKDYLTDEQIEEQKRYQQQQLALRQQQQKSDGSSGNGGGDGADAASTGS